jgi:hypothetical protein
MRAADAVLLLALEINRFAVEPLSQALGSSPLTGERRQWVQECRRRQLCQEMRGRGTKLGLLGSGDVYIVISEVLGSGRSIRGGKSDADPTRRHAYLAPTITCLWSLSFPLHSPPPLRLSLSWPGLQDRTELVRGRGGLAGGAGRCSQRPSARSCVGAYRSMGCRFLRPGEIGRGELAGTSTTGQARPRSGAPHARGALDAAGSHGRRLGAIRRGDAGSRCFLAGEPVGYLATVRWSLGSSGGRVGAHRRERSSNRHRRRHHHHHRVLHLPLARG